MPLREAVHAGWVFLDNKRLERWITALQELWGVADIGHDSKLYTLVPAGQFAQPSGPVGPIYSANFAKLLMFEHGVALLVLYDDDQPGGRERAHFWPKDRLVDVTGEKKLIQGQVLIRFLWEDGNRGSALLAMINPKGAATDFARAAKRHFGL